MGTIIIPIIIIGGLGLLFGLGLSYASKKFEVETDPRVIRVREILPGANCGACGYSGCDGYAEAVVIESESPSLCPVGGSDTASDLARIMGVEAEEIEPTVARVMCSGNNEYVTQKFDYDGIRDCMSAATMHGGPYSCVYGCLGMGNCLDVCAFDAIRLENGVAIVDSEKCTCCGECIRSCPKEIIKLVPKKFKYHVSCSNTEKGGIARKNCKVACIGCMKCQKECPFDAIIIENSLAKIDYTKCKNCGKCFKVCPTGAIIKKV